MPSAVQYIEPTSPLRNQWTQNIIQEAQIRRRNYRTAVEYYIGKQKRQVDLPEDGKYDDNTMINLVQMTADRTVSFLFPAMPEMIIDAASADDTPEEEYLKKFFKTNGGLKALTKLALRGFLSGHGFVRVKPPRYPGQMPIMTVLDPTQVTVYWAADDVSEVLWYEFRYYVGDVAYVEDVVRTGQEEWTTYTYAETKRSSAMNFSPYATSHGEANAWYLDRLTFGDGFELQDTAKHSSAIPPIIDIPHLPHPDDYYGLSEFTQKSLQDAINHLSSVRSRIVRENAEPVDVLTGAGADEVQMGGGVVAIENAAARVTRLEMKGDLVGITSTIDKLTETYLAIGRVVLLKGEAKDLQRVTNASVRTLFLDALSKNELLRSSYGEGLEKIARLALEIGWVEGLVEAKPTEIEPTVRFATPLPVDDTEVANINALGIAGGYMSKRTAAQRLDLDWTFEIQAMEDEAANEVLNPPVEEPGGGTQVTETQKQRNESGTQEKTVVKKTVE